MRAPDKEPQMKDYAGRLGQFIKDKGAWNLARMVLESIAAKTPEAIEARIDSLGSQEQAKQLKQGKLIDGHPGIAIVDEL